MRNLHSFYHSYHSYVDIINIHPIGMKGMDANLIFRWVIRKCQKNVLHYIKKLIYE